MAIFSGCGKSPQSAGTSTETTNGIAGIVLQQGSPVAGARIQIMHPGGRDLDTSLHSDSMGRFALVGEQLVGTTLHVLALRQDSSAMALHYHSQWQSDTNLALHLLPSQSLEITGLQPQQEIQLLGTPFQTRASDLGQARFAALPPGRYTALSQGIPQASLRVDALTPTVVELTNNAMLLEDFADGDDCHALFPWSGQGCWYISSRNGAQIIWPSNTHRFSSSLISQGSWRDLSFHLEYALELPESAVILPEPGVQVGLYLAPWALDLRDLDTLRFMARGNGLLMVALEQELPNGQFRKAIWERQLDGDWQSIVIAMDENIASPNFPEHALFSQVSDSIRLLTFFLKSGTHFSLDDIRLIGVPPEVFLLRYN